MHFMYAFDGENENLTIKKCFQSEKKKFYLKNWLRSHFLTIWFNNSIDYVVSRIYYYVLLHSWSILYMIAYKMIVMPLIVYRLVRFIHINYSMLIYFYEEQFYVIIQYNWSLVWHYNKCCNLPLSLTFTINIF